MTTLQAASNFLNKISLRYSELSDFDKDNDEITISTDGFGSELTARVEFYAGKVESVEFEYSHWSNDKKKTMYKVGLDKKFLTSSVLNALKFAQMEAHYGNEERLATEAYKERQSAKFEPIKYTHRLAG